MEIIKKNNKINYLSNINKHERDQYIEFEEENHVYTIKNNNDYTSVTTYISTLFEEFDSENVVNKIINSKNYKNPSYIYYKKSKKEILEMWENNRISSSTLGTQMHYFIECYYDCLYNPNLDFKYLYSINSQFILEDIIEYKYFMNFIEDHRNLIPFRTEWCVFDEQLKLAGSIDMVFRNSKNEFFIYDWKRCKNIEKSNRYNKFSNIEALEHIPDTNYWHYCIQLNIYKKILEENYNIFIKELYLVCIHPNNKNYIKIYVPILNDLLEELFNETLMKY